MGKRGPKSLAEIATVAASQVQVTARMDAPYDLADEESEVWKSIIESLPADWITPGSAPVLAAYCRCAVQARRLGQLIKSVELGKDEYDLGMHLELIREHGKVANTLKTLATSLRLTQQSRYTPQRAGTARTARGRKPWADGE